MPGEPAFAAYAQALLTAYRERLAGQGAAGSERAPSCTSHISVVDRHGNLVALTQTLLSSFGSKLLGAGHGPAAEQRHHVVRPPARRAQRDRTRAAASVQHVPGDRRCTASAASRSGASGGRRILPAVLQIASFLTDFGMELEAALHQPRLDVSGPDLVTVDARLGICAGPDKARRGDQPQPAPAGQPAAVRLRHAPCSTVMRTGGATG